jgi:drug/metabolite transporter (DMT)-like permease
VVISAIGFAGMYFLVPEFSIENDQFIGILFGLSSAALYALRNILLKKKAHKYRGDILMFYQMLVIILFFWPGLFLLPQQNWQASLLSQLSSLLILGIFTSAVGHSLFVQSLRYFGVSTIAILSNLTPVFGILLAIIWIGETPEPNTWIGGSLILISAFSEVLISRQK